LDGQVLQFPRLELIREQTVISLSPRRWVRSKRLGIGDHRHGRVSDVDKVETHVYTPPKDYGKIDIADFDPENYKNTSKRR